MLKKIILFFFAAMIAVSSVLYFVSDMSKYAGIGKTVNILLIIEGGSAGEYAGALEFILFQYNPEKKQMQFLFIDENISILKRKERTRTLKEIFYRQKENNRINFINKEISEMFKKSVGIDYYLYCDASTLNSFLSLFGKGRMNQTFGDDYLKIVLNGRDYLNSAVLKIKIIKYLMRNSGRNMLIDILKFSRNPGNVFSTNLTASDFFYISGVIKYADPDNVLFMDIPTVFRRNRIEIDMDSFSKLLGMLNFYYNGIIREKANLRVLNASNKNRLAEKAVNLLRKKGFDVFYWGNERHKKNFTVILDMINCHGKSEKIRKVLKCGEILTRPAPKPFADMTVMLGQDCTLYDKLDKIPLKTGD